MQAYNIPSKAIEGSKWIMGAKLENQSAIGSANKAKFSPGPGGYDPDYTKGTKAYPSFSIKGRYR